MKSAYELAMERLEKEKPSGPPITDDQKKAIAEIHEKYEAKIAQAKIMADQELFSAQGDYQTTEQIRARLREEIQKLEEERDYKKQQVREPKE
jgi:hypothetical protein